MEEVLYPQSMLMCAAMTGFIIGVAFMIMMFFVFDISKRKKNQKIDEEIIKKMHEVSNSFDELEKLVLPRE